MRRFQGYSVTKSYLDGGGIYQLQSQSLGPDLET